MRIDPATGMLPPVGLPTPVGSMEEYFLAGTEPHEAAPVDAAVVAPVDASAVVPSEVGDAGPAGPVENPVAAPEVVVTEDAATAPTD